jgi:hypothetical protein
MGVVLMFGVGMPVAEPWPVLKMPPAGLALGQ